MQGRIIHLAAVFLGRAANWGFNDGWHRSNSKAGYWTGRIEEHFLDQMQVPVSAGSIVNFNKDAFERLEFFDDWVKKQLLFSALITGSPTFIMVRRMPSATSIICASLKGLWEQDGQQWAQQMNCLFRQINQVVHDAGNCLDPTASELYRKRCQNLLQEAENECPRIFQRKAGKSRPI